MLTADLVKVRRKGRELVLAPLDVAERSAATVLADDFVKIAHEHVGRSRAELDDRATETWSAFGNRVARARAQLPTHARSGGTTLVMSSGGVIARCVQAALGIDDEHTVDMNLSLRNTGISEFHSSEHGWHLHTWNGLPHFSAPGTREWMTYY